jgi:predicted Zn-dependent protease
LLEKAENADEIAGVLAHELGHLRHRGNMRGMIHNGGTSFLTGCCLATSPVPAR